MLTSFRIGSNMNTHKAICALIFACVLCAPAEEVYLTDDQKRDRSEHIALVTIGAIEKGSNYFRNVSYRKTTENEEPHSREYTYEMQEWILHISDHRLIKGEPPQHQYVRIIEDCNIACPSFSISAIREGDQYLVYGKLMNGHIELLFNTNQFIPTVHDTYSVQWFETTGDRDQPYALRSDTMALDEYIHWLQSTGDSN